MRHLPSLLLFLSLILSFSACEDDEDVNYVVADVPVDVPGLNYTLDEAQSFSIVYNALTAKLRANPAIGVVEEVDHQQNAQNINAELPATRVVLFGNPTLGTPLMQANQRAGIDLPQKMLVYINNDGQTVTAYNNTAYLGQRHGVDSVTTLSQISTALQGLATDGGATTLVPAAENTVTADEGLIEIDSELTFDETYNKLLELLNRNPNLSIITIFNHQANAASVNLELRPTRLLVFGNPNLGTPLIQDRRTMGIDLPQKMLIYEDADGTTKVLYNDIAYLVRRHGVTAGAEQITQITAALANIAQTITRN
ncbi:DUF302 domain-containing protein [Neolewinella antarctica]|uniref:Uncharacterized protein (DUF302 family) n=1 Tax=Neolewinella antarctica TaxID=442734 RepID=A0ABX0XH61_9BACT|nr:DUF302 domain-containing protein [Neolewinella antarctica]NJC28206.1 uncharacterized protein (DUF302 family) [Neolewinella antarctica]